MTFIHMSMVPLFHNERVASLALREDFASIALPQIVSLVGQNETRQFSEENKLNSQLGERGPSVSFV